MIIIHGVDTLPRLLAASLARHLSAMPVVVVSGARQAGKSTLVRTLADKRRRYWSLDDLDVRDAARRDPQQLLGGDAPVILDEVQREPDLLHAIKLAVDSKRVRGRYLLTGSANLLLMRGVSESLAGRASYLILWPMTRREQLGLGTAGAWDVFFGYKEADWPGALEAQVAPQEPWQALARRGGFPTPALELDSAEERALWFDGYTRTYLERDLRDLASVASLPDYRRLMRATCLRLGQLVNQTEIGRDVALPQPTIHRWLNLLETSTLLVRLPAYAVNRTKRLIKAPKIYWADTGLAMHLAQQHDPAGAHLENIVLHDLLAWGESRRDRPQVAYWRTASGEEVDLVVEAGERLLPIEIEASARPRLSDAAHLRSFRAEYGKRAHAGLLLHTGSVVEWLAPDVLAAPWWRVL